jgi:pyruvate dehydrogenase E2 component (dihydrolipoamide acetyltransferase)
MHAFRSRVGVVSATAGAPVVLVLPVVAAGQVPVVDQVVGGVTQPADAVAPAPAVPALPAPPAPLQVPVANAPAAAPAAPAPAAPAPAAPAPAAQRQSAPAAAAQAAPSDKRSSARNGPEARSAARGESHVMARGASDAPARASQDDSAGEGAGFDAASQSADLPEDASPATLPFTGCSSV